MNTEALWEAFKQTLINSILIHLVFRLAAYVRRTTLYDESPYLMKLSKREDNETEVLHHHQEEEDEEQEDRQGKNSKKQRGGRSKSPAAVVQKKQTTSSTTSPNEIILVTGSSGRIGSAVVRALLEDGSYHVRGVDRTNPFGTRKFPNVDYRKIDLIDSTESEILRVLDGVVGVIHCSGTVALFRNFNGEAHNSITYCTVRLMWLARKAGVTAFVHTGSTVVINNGSLNINAIPYDQPYCEKQNSSWGKAHVRTEKAVLSASDDPKNETGRFFTCVNRFPGLYGLGDKLSVSVMIEDELSVFPSRTDVRCEMLYLKNAAHAHVCALKALLDKDARITAAARAQIITQSVEGETSTNLEFWTRARKALGIKRPIVVLPTILFYLVACIFDFTYLYFVGFLPKSILWNFTRPFLSSLLHDNTFLGQVEAFRAIGYKPKFTNESSFEDMARELRQNNTLKLELSKMDKKLLLQLDHNPKDDIDWEPREMPKNPIFLRSLFLTVLGPGISWHEIFLFWFSMSCSLFYAYKISEKFQFSQGEFIGAILIAGWNGPGTVVTMGPSNKRWFHLGGNIGVFLFVVMVLDLCASVTFTSLMYPPNNNEIIALEWLVFVGGCLLAGLFVIVFLAPLSLQRSYSVICFLLVVVLQYFDTVPKLRVGMDWVFLLLAFKFFICHGPRHEPYI